MASMLRLVPILRLRDQFSHLLGGARSVVFLGLARVPYLSGNIRAFLPTPSIKRKFARYRMSLRTHLEANKWVSHALLLLSAALLTV